MRNARLFTAFSAMLSFINISLAQGTWTALRDTAPNPNGGVMLLLTDGTVMASTTYDTNAVWDDAISNGWNKLTPDSTGSYVNGAWSVITPMDSPRLYFSSQVLQNGKVYVAGGEYGSGNTAELYDPLNDTWSLIPGIDSNAYLLDANSQVLPDGRVLDNIVFYDSGFDYLYGISNIIYNPATNSFTSGPSCLENDDESCWLKLPDNSIMFTAFEDVATERYIPSLNEWIPDAPMPELLYDTFIGELGAGLMLPDGRAFFLGSNGNTVYYTPSGNTTNGQWTVGPVIPDGNGTPDAPAAMLADGHILCAVAPQPDSYNIDSAFQPITFYYDFDYTTNTFTPLTAPTGGQSINQPSCSSMMLNLPDGNVLYAIEGSNQYYIYTPGNPPLASGKPVISAVKQNGCQYIITGTLFNGISQGSAYGDDWQMATNYPMVRLVANGKTCYARTTNWNRTGVQTGTLPDTAYFTLPANMTEGDYGLLLSANGISSDTFSFAYNNCLNGITEINNTMLQLRAIPNPASARTDLSFTAELPGSYTIRLSDICGRILLNQTGQAATGDNLRTLQLAGLAKGIYIASLDMNGQRYTAKIIVE